jgi:hypothetical protein
MSIFLGSIELPKGKRIDSDTTEYNYKGYKFKIIKGYSTFFLLSNDIEFDSRYSENKIKGALLTEAKTYIDETEKYLDEKRRYDEYRAESKKRGF